MYSLSHQLPWPDTALITLESNLCVHDSAELSKMERRGEEGKTERGESKKESE